MIQHIVDFSLRQRALVAILGVILMLWGSYTFRTLPIEAYPDVANNWVLVITQWSGHAAEEIEQQVSIPIETEMGGLPQLANLRSISVFGLSVVTLIFDDASDNFMNRQRTLERLSQVNLPPGLNPSLGPDYSPVGQIYWYTLTSTNPEYDLMELKAMQDWEISKRLRSVSNVVDVTSFGGLTREYQVLVDPNKLISYGISITEINAALAANNLNAGGSFIERGNQQINIRAIGLMTNVDDIGATVIKIHGTTPIRVRDIGVVTQGSKIRQGKVGKAIHREDGRVIDNDDVVEGIVLLRKGAEFDATIKAVENKVKELNEHYLPPGVKIVGHLDRHDLIEHTTHTVMHNLIEGMLLVVAVLFLFLGNIRSALIVALTIPFSLLFASVFLDLRHIPANLLSLGALDFGMVVDGAVVMVENISRHMQMRSEQKQPISQIISHAAHEVQRPVFYAIAVIITAYLPIFTLQRVEGKLFQPMAWTVGFVLLGALVFSMVMIPMIASFIMHKGTKEWRNPVIEWLKRKYRQAIVVCIKYRTITVAAAAATLSGSLLLGLSGAIGSEFLPHLDEGAIWVRGALPASVGPSEANRVVRIARQKLASYPEVIQVVSQVGRPDDGTDVSGFFNTEYFVDLKLRQDWRPQFKTKDQLIEAMHADLQKIPGVTWNFSQPIEDNMEEAVSGVKGQLAIKLYGADLKQLEHTADNIAAAMRKIQGIADLGIFRIVGQPNINIKIDRAKIDRFGLNVSDVQNAVETALGSRVVSQILQGERRFDLVVRYQQQYRQTLADVSNIRLLAPSGEHVSLSQIATITENDGASMIYREDNSRYIAIKYSVRGRDLGSTVEEAMERVNREVELPDGYSIKWAGEYESQKRAQARLAIIVPLTVMMILLILFSMFSSIKWALLIMTNVVLAPIGGLLALYLTGTYFSVSSGIGFLALFGVSVQTGIIMVEYINQLRSQGLSITEAAVEGAVLRLRPIMMTMLVATIGLLPAAMSYDIGSDSQRPFAIVIVGGLIVDLVMSALLLPTLYVWVAKETDSNLPRPVDHFRY
ncbi:MAG: efflux RND transporter permease subunit [Betaproteobacteria bacterium]|nr:efflux RND transporter permease subunit [Betaproteobacteria bacterium]